MRFPRASGVLLHPTSLPGPHGSGDLGLEAYHFVDWLVAAGQKLWQMLPLSGIGPGNSPYMSNSAFAGNVLLVDLAELQRQGWLDAADLLPVAGLDGAPEGPAAGQIDYAVMYPFRMERLAKAAARFAAAGTPAQHEDFQRFQTEHASWLPDYALFMSLCEACGWLDWCNWAPELARREPAALAKARSQHAERIAFWQFCQWRFYRQWAQLKAYANGKGVQIIGDTPIFIAYLSAEVWANQHLFALDEAGRPTVVAGVPPDFFSATGQRWGNPLYRWTEHAKDGYAWWVERVRRTFELVDIVRIDHFRGFAGHWEIPSDCPTAAGGRWVAGPGAALFDALETKLGRLPVVAEDLGLITPDVVALRERYGLPGMRIVYEGLMQGGRAGDHAFLPHHHVPRGLVYSSTHDSDTVAGWWAGASADERAFTAAYLGLAIDAEPAAAAQAVVRATFTSVAALALAPLQDLMGLGSAHRMNRPGTAEGNWAWRFDWPQLEAVDTAALAALVAASGRAPRAAA